MGGVRDPAEMPGLWFCLTYCRYCRYCHFVFWDQVEKLEGEDSCWEWRGRRRGRGYGYLPKPLEGGTETAAHRAAWELEIGPIPDGLFVCHHCDNPPCVRPTHLFLGTNADNMRDMVAKGRHLERTQAWIKRSAERRNQRASVAEWHSVPSAADLLSVTPRMIRYWLESGNMRGIRLPSGRWRISQAEIDRIMMTGERGGE